MFIKVQVTADAKREKVTRKSAERYDIAVKEPAEMNLANNRLREILSEELDVPIAKIRLISGHHHPHKIFSVLD